MEETTAAYLSLGKKELVETPRILSQADQWGFSPVQGQFIKMGLVPALSNAYTVFVGD